MSPRFTVARFLSALCLCLFACSAFAQPQPQTENRFLFIINTSSAMRRMTNGIHETVLGLIKSGMQGQMRDGDTFSIWTYDDHVHTDFPLGIWTRQTAPMLMEKVGEFLDAEHFEKKAHLEKVLPLMHEVIAQSRVLTVIFVFDGTETMQGVEFDKDINDLHKEFGRQVRADNEPFVTVLSAHDGKIFDYRVRTPAAIALPQTADFFTNTPPPAAPTNVPATVVAVAPPPPPPHRLDIVLEPSTPRKTNPPVAIAAPPPPEPAPSVVQPVPAPVLAPTPVSTPTNLAAAPAEPTNSHPAVVPEPPTSITVPTAPARNPLPVAPPESTPPPVKEVAVIPVIPHEETPATNSPAQPAPPSSSPPTATAAPQVLSTAVALPTPTDHMALLIIAFSLVMIAAVLLVFLLRRSRATPPSLISQSLDRSP